LARQKNGLGAKIPNPSNRNKNKDKLLLKKKNLTTLKNLQYPTRGTIEAMQKTGANQPTNHQLEGSKTQTLHPQL